MAITEKTDSSAPAAKNEEGAVRLSEEDMQRVEKYLQSPVHSVERKPFRPWLMMLGLVGVIIALSLLSLLISRWVLG